eukprot:Nitzschia sp. Nitz4//scaffold22_size323478//212631//215111//NITZ4_000559-RA/size323478-processed-gene-0.415-mRNA-1//1//CDS//3329543091//1715//frame0
MTLIELADEPGTGTPKSRRLTMSREERQLLRKKNKKQAVTDDSGSNPFPNDDQDDKLKALLASNEDNLLKFVAKVNKVYQECLNKSAPFMTFVFCGMQSAGKSTIMERFLNSVLNIVQQGTGTRCPLDTTCIHDSQCKEPTCELYGEELPKESQGENLPVHKVFEFITEHNRMLGREDRFSTKSLHLVYRASNVQNMRFVDTPGIISNASTGKDNREDIKRILRSEMRKPNTKLCVLLEPKEFATNPILDFCDMSLGGRDKWIDDATFLMTKFDKQLDDARTAKKANDFFQEFFQNKCHPHLVITPTLDREDLPAEELFKARMRLIQDSDEYETEKFEAWQDGHAYYNSENADNEVILDHQIATRIGFTSAKKHMRHIMLEDTVARLPEVLSALRNDLNERKSEQKALLDRKKFTDPSHIRDVITRLMYEVQERMISYLDGDLKSSMKFPERLLTLHEEIEEEEDSDWVDRELNHHTDNEDEWRDRVAQLKRYPEIVCPNDKFLGGKQYQRALAFFGAVMIESLPDPYELRDKVPNLTGFLSGGLQQENWERAMVEITRECLRNISHPGLNFLVKHIGHIFRRLFEIALQDVKLGEKYSSEFQMVPPGIERFLVHEFEEMLWNLMEKVSAEVHSSMEPMYSSIDPNLPTFACSKMSTGREEKQYVMVGGEYRPANEIMEEKVKSSWVQTLASKMNVLSSLSNSNAKSFLQSENSRRANVRRSLLPDERTAMINGEETNLILSRCFEYIVALMEFNLVVFRFQLNHHFYEGFKTAIRSELPNKVHGANWDELVSQDSDIDDRLEELQGQIDGLGDALREVQRMQRGF